MGERTTPGAAAPELSVERPVLKAYRPQSEGFAGQDVESWERSWEDVSLDTALRWAEICHLRPVFDRYFPRDGKILEGGCGIGQFVVYYRRRGYDIEGVDFSPSVVERLSRVDPALPVRVADVTALPYPDGYFACYYSGGVVEHFEEGPFRALAEARRVLSRGGTLLITVPFVNWVRRVRFSLPVGAGRDGVFMVPRREFRMEPPPAPHLRFMEYYFTGKEFAEILRDAGFRILEARPCDVEWGEVCLGVGRLLRRRAGASDGGERSAHGPAPGSAPGNSPRARTALRQLWKDLFVSEDRRTLARRVILDALSAVSGHMLLFVCRTEGRV